MNNVLIEVTGKNINIFIKRLFKNNIDILNVNYLDSNKVIVTIYVKDLKIVKRIKTIYKVKVIKYTGLSFIKSLLWENKILFICIIIGIMTVLFLSRIIFKIEVIHSDPSIQKLIINELSLNGVKVHKLKKSKKCLERIKSDIVKKYDDKIEWIEIEEKGLFYIVKVIDKVSNPNEENCPNRSIIAKKNGVISRIVSDKGVIEKIKGEYVKKGDIIINGEIYLNDGLKNKVCSRGNVYADVWYNVTVKYPYNYKEKIYSGNSKRIVYLKIFNKKISIYSMMYTNCFEDIIYEYRSNFLPISIVFSNEKEIINIDEVYTEDEVINLAINKSTSSIMKRLNDDEYINSYKILNTRYYDNYIELDLFYSINENITDYLLLE